MNLVYIPKVKKDDEDVYLNKGEKNLQEVYDALLEGEKNVIVMETIQLSWRLPLLILEMN